MLCLLIVISLGGRTNEGTFLSTAVRIGVVGSSLAVSARHKFLKYPRAGAASLFFGG